MLLGLGLCSMDGAQVPEAEISNGLARATLYLPDQDHGYYRGARFDWSGVVESLSYAGHTYCGQQFERCDSPLRNAVPALVDEFVSAGGALGYANAKPGGLFIKIGVGLLRKPDGQPYSSARSYEIVSPGLRIVRPEPDRVEFVHELSDGDGYAYVYSKTVRLERNKPVLVIDHVLKNTGRKIIETSVYNYDFLRIDGRQSRPNASIVLKIAPKRDARWRNTYTCSPTVEPVPSSGR